ncbi:hypothetical protein A167_02409 [Alcanivorax sp. S71-1-4]|uniref:protein adenylyltransferase SelO family protein n=1 Tax=Alcanivorax sp. S71-1-4 TaxID=1177159 RepID=UPI00135A044A|nr:protein adenylyltransferase SelO family protein [Alcanivorax sp. S71-1-4]KAF0808820.1 hypothetical protein A167_02409 [Alcanivorax sp. S71-1-4]
MNMLLKKGGLTNPWRSLPLVQGWQQLPPTLWSPQPPQPLPVCHLADMSPAALRLLQLDARQVRTDAASVATLRALHAGERLLPGMAPLAQKYAGHQHGVFNPMLGDGRALLLGEVAMPLGRLDLYIKGSGRTPFSRNGDGRLGLRSALREYLASHALYGLGIATSLPLSLCVHDARVQRTRLEPAATVLRLAPSHVRIGHFEWLHYRRDTSALSALIASMGQCHGETPAPDTETFFRHVVLRCAQLVAAWQVWGFVHGTLNTDNLSVLGLTLDHGTCVFMEQYQPSLAPARDDVGGRYAFAAQPQAMAFGLSVLARCLTPLVPLPRLQAALDDFDGQVERAILCGMRSRLGWIMSRPEDGELVAGWLRLLHRHGADYSRAFRVLMSWGDTPGADAAFARALGFAPDAALPAQWLASYRQRLQHESATVQERQRFMAGVNPVYVLRERHLQRVEAAAEQGDFQPLASLRRCLTQPFQKIDDCEFND